MIAQCLCNTKTMKANEIMSGAQKTLTPTPKNTEGRASPHGM